MAIANSYWDDHPYRYRGPFWAYRPTVVFKAQVDSTTAQAGTSIYTSITPKNITLGRLQDLHRNMTIIAGSSDGADDYGRARIKGTDGAYTYIIVWVSPNIHDGELYLPANAYIEVWNDYRLWAKTPFAYGAQYYYDGDQWTTPVYNREPVANAGPPWMEEIDSNGKIRVTLDASTSFAGAARTCLGDHSADQMTNNSNLTVSSTGAGNKSQLLDSDTGTGWESSTPNAGEWIAYDFGSAVRLRKYRIYAGTNKAPNRWYVQYRDNTSAPWISAGHEMDQDAWVAVGQYITYYVQDVGAHRYWRWYLMVVNVGGTAYQVMELDAYIEDRTAGSSPWSWDIADGTIVSGAVTDESLVVDFEGGVRVVTLNVTDNKAGSYPGGDHYKPVLAYSDDTHYYDLSGVTESASEVEAGYPASNAADESHTTYWRTQDSTYSGWLKFRFASSKRYLTGYAISFPSALSDDNAPYTWTFQGSHDDATYYTLDTQTAWTGFSTAGYHEFDLDFPVGFEYYRLNVTTIKTASGSNFLAVAELALYSDQGVLHQKIAASRLSADAGGQEFTATLHEPLDLTQYPPGTLVMYKETEWFNNTQGPLTAAALSNNDPPTFWGWLTDEAHRSRGTLESARFTTQITAHDPGRRLREVVGYNLGLQRDENPSAGYEMRRSTMDTAVMLLMMWCTTGAEVTDFFWSNFAEQYGFGVYDLTGNNPYRQADNACQAMAMRFTCNRFGQLRMVPDLNLRSSDERTYWGTETVQLTGADVLTLDETHSRNSRFHWLWGKGMEQFALDADDVLFSVTPFKCVVPGEAPGQGVGLLDMGHQLVFDQSELNTREGNRGAVRLNQPHTNIKCELAHRGNRGLDPAEVDSWIDMTIATAEAPERGWVMTNQDFLITRIDTQHDPEKGTKRVLLYLEAYRTGRPAVTVS